MAEYIERKAAIDAVKQNVPYAYHAVAIALASMIPTADVKPVVRGEWIYKAGKRYEEYTVSCPFCEATYHDCYDGYIDAENFNYCPNCGADMRGNNDDNG